MLKLFNLKLHNVNLTPKSNEKFETKNITEHGNEIQMKNILTKHLKVKYVAF